MMTMIKEVLGLGGGGMTKKVEVTYLAFLPQLFKGINSKKKKKQCEESL